MKAYPCPRCGEDVLTPEDAYHVYCFYCNAKLRVNRDAEHTDGLWRDLTSLTIDENSTNPPD